MGGRTGLRYEACIATLGTYLPAWQQDQPSVWQPLTVHALMQDIQIIETALLAAWAEQSTDSKTKD